MNTTSTCLLAMVILAPPVTLQTPFITKRGKSRHFFGRQIQHNLPRQARPRTTKTNQDQQQTSSAISQAPEDLGLQCTRAKLDWVWQSISTAQNKKELTSDKPSVCSRSTDHIAAYCCIERDWKDSVVAQAYSQWCILAEKPFFIGGVNVRCISWVGQGSCVDRTTIVRASAVNRAQLYSWD